VRIVLDTNVFVSGVFFAGPPNRILQAWRDRKVDLVVSPEILEEYQNVGIELRAQFPQIDLSPILDLLVVMAEVCLAPSLPAPVCRDPEDDKFLACALAARVAMIVSGDKDLLAISGYRGIKVITPRSFVNTYL
jgi:putative PIN family toxin of toxin-antitoxin system